jgi:hypothetical protein
MPSHDARLEIDQFGRGYARPRLVRDSWVSLNGDLTGDLRPDVAEPPESRHAQTLAEAGRA